MIHKKIKHQRKAESKRITFPTPDKTPSIIEYPAFSLYYLQDAYCIKKCTIDEKSSFADKLRVLSKMTWNQIMSSPHLGLGSEKIERGTIKVPIPKNISDDVSFLAIRFHERKPMVGFRVSNIFNIVWFDRDFSLYDHGN